MSDFPTVAQAVVESKLDRRFKYTEFCGQLIRNYNYTALCTGCDGGGCLECGWHGKVRSSCPIPLFDIDGNAIEVIACNDWIRVERNK